MHKRQNMQAFLDTLVGVPQVLQDSAEDKKMVVRFKATQANVVNDNLFLYPRNILQDAINESNELINQNRMIGETPHPRHFTGRNGQVVFDAKVENSVTKIINQFMDETGTVFVDAEVLDTAKGQDLKALIKAGVPVGISLRAIGDSVKKPIGGRMVNVATKLHIRAYDPVMNPATAGCEAVQVLTDAQVEEAMKDAVQITCPCCPDCNCQMEAKDPDQDGDTDFYFCPSCKDVYVPDEQKSMTMTATQTLRKLPNDPDYDGYQLARQFKMDMAKIVVKDNMQKGDDLMNKFISMTLEQLKAWKTTNPGHADMAVCDSMIELKEQAAKSQALTDEIQRIKQKEEVERKKEEARKVLTDAVNALPYEQHVKEGLLQKGAVITDSAEVASFIETEKAFIDSIAVKSKLNDLGVPQNGRAQTIDPSVVVVGQGQPWKPIVDNLQTALDDQMRSMDRNFRPDNALRGANMAILDRIMAKLDRENSPEYRELMKGLTDSAQSIENGVITDSALSTTGDFAQVAAISMAFMRQVWQDLKFAQLVMAEAYGGDTYRIPVEFQSHDLYTQDDFVTGEFDGITTEGVSTFFLEFGGEWLKRGTVISKEAQIQLQKGPFNYDVVARNLANLAMRFQRIIDQKMSLEMLHTSDEYQAVSITDEAVAATEMSNTGLPSGSNAVWSVKLLCGNTSGSLPSTIPPVVRPRNKVWLDHTGRKKSSMTNDIVAKKGSTVLTRGSWDPIKGMINPLPGQTKADYAIDFENAKVYFAESAGVDNDANRPTISYSYATNVSFFNLKVPAALADNPARYYNQLLERFDYERAYMGSAPRYVAPDFAIGSLNAMVNLKIAELFYKWASPEGTNFLKGDMWIANRNGLQIGEINAPWAAGDQRMLLGKTNATRFGVGSPLQIEGPEPYFDPTSMKITSARQYFGTQQISLATPLVIDDNGVTYNPPYRTIKFYNA